MEDQESEGEGIALTSTQTNLINVNDEEDVDAATDIPLSTELIECGFGLSVCCDCHHCCHPTRSILG